jgi:hypothetical protein
MKQLSDFVEASEIFVIKHNTSLMTGTSRSLRLLGL